MNNFIKISLITILSVLTLAACSGFDDDVDIPITEVPANLVTIIQNTLPGITLTHAEKEIKNDTVIYEVNGKLINGKEYEIKLKQDGTILKVELED